jgi:ATP-binding cassette subfamily F protein 3
LLSGLGFSNEQMEQPVNALSGGWKMRLNLAKALMCRSDLLLLDEPTNHLDFDAILWLQTWLERYEGTLIMISHDRDFLDAVVKTILHIEQSKLTAYKGNYSGFEQQRAAKLALQSAAHAKQQRDIAHMEAFVTRFKAQATKAKQAQSRVKALERMQLIAPAHVDSQFRFKFVEADKTPDSLLKITDASVGYGDSPILKDVGLGLVAGDRIGLIGANGAGKSTLIKLIENSLTPMSGSVTRSKHLKVGYFAQHQLDHFDADLTPFHYLSKQQPRYREQEVYDHLGGFGFKKARVDESVRHFSGGEKARLALALLVAQRPNCLLLDEPTNHLDLEMRHALTVALQAFNGALLVVSHDRFLLRSVADKLVLVNNGKVAEYEGDLDDYRKLILKAQSEAEVPFDSDSLAPTVNKKDQRKARAEQREKLKPILKEVASLEKKLAKLTDAQAQFDAKLMDETLYEAQKSAELTQILKEKAQIDKEHEIIESQWLEMALALEEAQDL